MQFLKPKCEQKREFGEIAQRVKIQHQSVENQQVFGDFYPLCIVAKESIFNQCILDTKAQFLRPGRNRETG